MTRLGGKEVSVAAFTLAAATRRRPALRHPPAPHLEVTTEDGDRVFQEVEINDTDVMESFSRRDAEEFVRRFRALKAARR